MILFMMVLVSSFLYLFVSFCPFPRWFKPEEHFETLSQWMDELLHTNEKVYDVLDLFGATQKVSRTFESAGHKSVSFDIKLSSTQDLVSESGFRELLDISSRLPSLNF